MRPNFVSPTGASRTNSDRVIVNCGIGRHYEDGRRSTLEHCNRNCPEAWQLFYDDYPDGCPPQSQRQYAFKIFALDEAIRSGFRYILWMDTVFQPLRSIEPLWEVVEREGWYVPRQGDALLGHWCSDRALDQFGIDRPIALDIPLVYSGLVGLDMQTEIGWRIWRKWKQMYELGTFNGAHQNKPGEPIQPWGNKLEGHVSYDPGVQGHRHDESALSYVLHSLGLHPKTLGFLTLEDPNGFIGHHVKLEAVCPGV